LNNPHGPTASAAPPAESFAESVARHFAVFGYTRKAVQLVWDTNRRLAITLALLTLAAGLLPAAMAWVGKLIVDGVVMQMDAVRGGAAPDYWTVLQLVLLEGLFIALTNFAQRGINACQALLRAQLGHRVNVLILEKSLTLDLSQFEDSEFYDKLQRARRGASSRPLSLVMRSFSLFQELISLVSFGILIAQFSIWAMVLLVLAGLPAFVAEAKFSGDAFRLFRFRTPESRLQNYLEIVMAREDHVQEVKLFGLGPMLLQRYRDIFKKLYKEDRALTLRRESWGLALSLLGTVALYGAYIWIVIAAIDITITLGEMTMYLVLFRRGQGSVASGLRSMGGIYEDNLYLTTLFEYLEQKPVRARGEALRGPAPDDGVRFENVSFRYPGAPEPTLLDINLHIRPGESLALVGENGAGKSTLIKLMCGFYRADSGRVLLHGLDIQDWEPEALHRCIAVIFQDFNRYQFTIGENIGTGDVDNYANEDRWEDSARKGMAMPFIEKLEWGFKTQLGTWFKGGKELSTGQWQKIALSRAFMRQEAEVLVLDEPTAAMDAAAEAELFEYFREHTKGRIAILISHRFSTVRQADRIAVLENGTIIEVGSHDSLLNKDGLYARLFLLQAEGYR